MPGWDDTPAALARLVAMVDEMDDLLAGGSPYRDLSIAVPGGGRHVDTLSIGIVLDLLEAVSRDADSLTPESRARLEAVRVDIDRRRRAPAYRGLVLRELRSQLHSWRWTADELREDDAGAADSRQATRRNRLRVRQLLREAEALGLDVREERAAASKLEQGL